MKLEEKMFGHPVKLVRMMFKKNKRFLWTVEGVADDIGKSKLAATRLINRLTKEGYIVKENGHWRNTTKGNSLAGSSLKRYKRETAERIVAEFEKRIAVVNRDKRFLHRVVSAVIFGSYLSESPDVGDVDIALRLAPKFANHKKQDEAEQKARHKSGRSFRNFIEMLYWPEDEVLRFLRNRSPVVSVHEWRDIVSLCKKKHIEYHVMYGDKKNISEQLKQGVMRCDNETENNCVRCGKCCGMIGYIELENEDIERFLKHGRNDLASDEMLEEFDNFGGTKIFNKDGYPYVGCPFLKKENGKSACGIEEVKPNMCREFVAGSKHAKRVAGCPAPKSKTEMKIEKVSANKKFVKEMRNAVNLLNTIGRYNGNAIPDRTIR